MSDLAKKRRRDGDRHAREGRREESRSVGTNFAAKGRSLNQALDSLLALSSMDEESQSCGVNSTNISGDPTSGGGNSAFSKKSNGDSSTSSSSSTTGNSTTSMQNNNDSNKDRSTSSGNATTSKDKDAKRKYRRAAEEERLASIRESDNESTTAPDTSAPDISQDSAIVSTGPPTGMMTSGLAASASGLTAGAKGLPAGTTCLTTGATSHLPSGMGGTGASGMAATGGDMIAGSMMDPSLQTTGFEGFDPHAAAAVAWQQQQDPYGMLHGNGMYPGVANSTMAYHPVMYSGLPIVSGNMPFPSAQQYQEIPGAEWNPHLNPNLSMPTAMHPGAPHLQGHPGVPPAPQCAPHQAGGVPGHPRGVVGHAGVPHAAHPTQLQHPGDPQAVPQLQHPGAAQLQHPGAPQLQHPLGGPSVLGGPSLGLPQGPHGHVIQGNHGPAHPWMADMEEDDDLDPSWGFEDMATSLPPGFESRLEEHVIAEFNDWRVIRMPGSKGAAFISRDTNVLQHTIPPEILHYPDVDLEVLLNLTPSISGASRELSATQGQLQYLDQLCAKLDLPHEKEFAYKASRAAVFRRIMRLRSDYSEVVAGIPGVGMPSGVMPATTFSGAPGTTFSGPPGTTFSGAPGSATENSVLCNSISNNNVLNSDPLQADNVVTNGLQGSTEVESKVDTAVKPSEIAVLVN